MMPTSFRMLPIVIALSSGFAPFAWGSVPSIPDSIDFEVRQVFNECKKTGLNTACTGGKLFADTKHHVPVKDSGYNFRARWNETIVFRGQSLTYSIEAVWRHDDHRFVALMIQLDNGGGNGLVPGGLEGESVFYPRDEDPAPQPPKAFRTGLNVTLSEYEFMFASLDVAFSPFGARERN